MTATEYGSLMHTVMQHLDFHGDLSDKGILAQLQNLADSEIIQKQNKEKYISLFHDARLINM